MRKCFETVGRFDAFDDGNDPWQEHDFGAFEVEGQRCYFKIEASPAGCLRSCLRRSTDIHSPSWGCSFCGK
jgi:hypothetical protein